MLDKINVNKLFKHKSYDHAIESKNKSLYFDFIYNLFITKFEIFKKFYRTFFCRLQTHLSCSSKKKTENLRLCVNYRNLNCILVKNRYFI